MDVPLPLIKPLKLVAKVKIGVLPPLLEPVKPLDDATDTDEMLEALIVWFGQVPLTVILVPATIAGLDVPVPPLAIATTPVTLDAVPVVFWFNVGNVQLAKLPDVGVPKIGVVSVGEVDNTTLPEPVVL